MIPRLLRPALVALTLAFASGCGRGPIVASDLPMKRVVVYRNGVAYFERGGRVGDEEVRFKMHEEEVGDFLATLAVMEKGGSSVRSAAFPLKEDSGAPPDDGDDRPKQPEPSKKRLRDVVLRLDGKEHDLQVGYVARSPVWRPSYRLVVRPKGQAELQAWGIVENLSGEDWKDVDLTLVAGAPLAFESQLGTPTIPPRPLVTDEGEVITAVPTSETSLQQREAASAPAQPVTAAPGAAPEDEAGADVEDAASMKRAAKPSRSMSKAGRAGGGAAPATGAASTRVAPGKKDVGPSAPPPPPPPPSFAGPSQPRDLRALAAVAQEGGTTRYRLPTPVTVPNQSATMVMLLSLDVPGEAAFLFASDPGVPDSARHPFRVARFSNKTSGALERGPIAVFENGAFLGQGVLAPLPIGATTTVPFALERGVGVVRSQKWDDTGERIAKIENGALFVERDRVAKTTYRVENGLADAAKLLVKHPRQPGARLHDPPPGTEDNTGAGSALVPWTVGARETKDLLVDERSSYTRQEDWFSPVADAAYKAYAADPRADRGVVARLDAAWKLRAEIVQQRDARQKTTAEEAQLRAQSEETRRNLKAIEKNKAADGLRAKLTQRLAAMAARLDELTKHDVEIDTKLAELDVRFREAVREIKLASGLPAKS
jgi:hypothetical protein